MSSTEQKLKICENKNNNKHSQRRSGKPGWSSEEGKTNLVTNRETGIHVKFGQLSNILKKNKLASSVDVAISENITSLTE